MSATPTIAAIVLAAGFSRRFGADDKLLADINGQPLLVHSLAAYADAPLSQKIAVLQPQSPMAEICASAGFETVINNKAAEGMGSSIASAMPALTKASHVLIGLGDMPSLQSDTVSALCRAATKADIVIPTHQGRRGHPRMFGAAHFPALRQLSGDTGARALIEDITDIVDMPVDDDGILLDIDTQEHLAARQT